jgi:hypothetical protein
MLEIDRTVTAPVDAPPERCRAVLSDVEGYPEWSSLITTASREGEHVRLRASVLGVGFEMVCVLDIGGERVVLRRLPDDPSDEERFEATWALAAGSVSLHVRAALDAPGPARMIRGRVERRVVDDLLADFTRAVGQRAAG